MSDEFVVRSLVVPPEDNPEIVRRMTAAMERLRCRY